MYKDFRKILLPFCARKAHFDEMPEPELGMKEIAALEYLADKGLVLEIPKNASAYDDVFGDDPTYRYDENDEQALDSHYTAFPLEWIVIRGDEFFYVDNEGYQYCRYGFKIADDIVNLLI